MPGTAIAGSPRARVAPRHTLLQSGYPAEPVSCLLFGLLIRYRMIEAL
jgi:hypothetical protein